MKPHIPFSGPARSVLWPLIQLALPLALLACSQHEAPHSVLRPAVVMTVSERADASWSVYSGEVHARHEVDQSFRIAGKVISRQVNLGDKVHKGQALAELDPQDARLSANANQAQVAAAQADLTLAQAELERARNLAAQKFISGSVLDTRRSQVDAAQARLNQAKAQASVSGNQVGYTALTADRDGVVTALPVEAGQVISAGQAVARIADPSELEVLIWIPETRAATIKPGDPALVRPWNTQEKTLAASVREVAGSADATTRTFSVRVKLAQPDASLSLGSTAAVAFAAPTNEHNITIPLPAVIKRDANTLVWVVDAHNTVRPRVVDVAEYRDESAVIRHGLVLGERVVIVGAHTLTAGITVRPVEQIAPVALDVKR